MRILVAHSDPRRRDWLCQLVTTWGHEVAAVDNASRAWTQLAAGAFAAVICDLKVAKGGICSRLGTELTDRVPYVVLLADKQQLDADLLGTTNMLRGVDAVLPATPPDGSLAHHLASAERLWQREDAWAQQVAVLESRVDELREQSNRQQREITAAVRAQRDLLPKTNAIADTLLAAYRFQPCYELSGDALDWFALDDRHVGIYIADVSGHGADAALLAVALQQLLTPFADHANLLATSNGNSGQLTLAAPSEVLGMLNRRFPIDVHHTRYFTLLYGVLDTHTGQFRYATAGHPGPIHISTAENSDLTGEYHDHAGGQPVVAAEGRVQEFPGGGFPIGFAEDAIYREHEIRLEPRDRLVVFTDGVVETNNAAGELFGAARLCQVLSEYGGCPLETVLEETDAQLKLWNDGPRSDDTTLAIVEYLGAGADKIRAARPAAEPSAN